MHKVLANGRVRDFYFASIYWEMDGMDRYTNAFFAEKYDGYLPVCRGDARGLSRTYRLRHLQLEHAENGDPIVSLSSLMAK